MNFSHLPMAGGLYDQNPKLLDRFLEIMAAEAREERKREAKREQDRKNQSRVAGRKRR